MYDLQTKLGFFWKKNYFLPGQSNKLEKEEEMEKIERDKKRMIKI